MVAGIPGMGGAGRVYTGIYRRYGKYPVYTGIYGVLRPLYGLPAHVLVRLEHEDRADVLRRSQPRSVHGLEGARGVGGADGQLGLVLVEGEQLLRLGAIERLPAKRRL